MNTAPETGGLPALAGRLRGHDAEQARAAAWEVLGLAERLADHVAWETGVDTVQALATASSCREARHALPLPAVGAPAPDPAPDPATAAEVARLLGELAARTDRFLAPDADGPTAAAHATAARQNFEALSRSWPGPRHPARP
ncbi:hypothetical protein [Streptomyces olivaceus]|uniref:hypothetical protein n=1 Tax=Streptomyces olivaceus TaxID=47716 RepID=UPI0036C1E562